MLDMAVASVNVSAGDAGEMPARSVIRQVMVSLSLIRKIGHMSRSLHNGRTQIQ